MPLSKHVIFGWVGIVIASVATHPTSVSAFTPQQLTFSKHQPSKHQPFISLDTIGRHQGRQYYDLTPLQATNNVEDTTKDPQDRADDLTKQELNLRFWEVRDFYRQHPEEKMTQADVCLKLLSTRLANIRLNRCYVAPSTIEGAGNGLFASRDIENEELITMYPGDAVLIESPSAAAATPAASEDNESSSPPPVAPSVVGVMLGNHIQGADRNPDRMTTPEAKSYEMEINQYTSIVADPQIGFEDTAYLGHFANDGEALYEFDADSREIYSKGSTERQNSAHFVMEGAHMVTVATQPIAKGEEIFVSYGEGYWLSRSYAALGNMAESEKKAIFVEIAAAKSSSESPNGTGTRPGTKSVAKKKDASPKGKSKGFGK
jgi:hypothetical protein